MLTPTVKRVSNSTLASAVDVLETAAEIGDAEQPDWRILQELGLAYRDATSAHSDFS